MPASLPSFQVFVLAFLMLYSTGGVNGCSVDPSSAAVVVGDDLSLTCTTQSKSEFVMSWRLESDFNTAPVLYKAGMAEDGIIIEERKVADGYLVNDSKRNVQVILTIVKASTVQANYYYCLCSGSTSAFAYVSVLGTASEPTFSNTTEIIDGEPVIFTCSVSFIGAANISVSIDDSYGTSLNKSSYDGTSKGLHSFSLKYSVTANSKVNQEYLCNFKLTNDASKTKNYSRKLSASVQWVPVRNIQITPIDRTQCSGGKHCSINQTIRCTAEGNPKPGTFQWMTSVNGGGFTKTGTSGDQFTFTNTGRYEVQCIAFNEIFGTRYNDSSIVFKTEVGNGVLKSLDDPPSGEQSTKTVVKSNSTALIIGVVVGVGAFILIVSGGIVIFLIRRKRKRDENNTRDNQSPELPSDQ